MVLSAEETLRRLTIGEPALLPAIERLDRGDPPIPRLDERTEALVRVAVLVALDAPVSAYHTAVGAAVLAGVSLDDLVATLFAVAGSVGSARVISAAPRLALAAGYDVDVALESSEASDS
jgi:alkylhydroperoxidase/carboxymuconolactone decarboxylase family protein YurZ